MDVQGPLAWRNRQERSKGTPPKEHFECMFYSDTHVTGEVSDELGPYQLLNAIPNYPSGELAPAIVLRGAFCVELEADMSRTDDSTYHGADVFEEVAALLSLGLGIRCRSGGRTRMWA